MSTTASRSRLKIMGYVYGNPEEKKTRDGKIQRIADCYTVIQSENGKFSNRFECRTEVPEQVICNQSHVYTYKDETKVKVCCGFIWEKLTRTFTSNESGLGGVIERERKSCLPLN